MIRIIAFCLLVFCSGTICMAQDPEPYGALPTQRQLDWAEIEYYMFVHFSMNTFTDMEWGTGGEDPALFDPSDLDCMQWARIAKEAGMKGIIITAKHHDGFVLWPSAYTEHSVKNSPWKDGKGDVLRELREACDYYGLKMGIYYSPWDRNHADYGTEDYLEYLHLQLEEVLTQYGEIFEVWFDGANGGSGYYGGANEERQVDRQTYYNWPRIWNHVRELQPSAVIFSDAGPDVRWVGNERGFAGKTNWSTLNRDLVWPGWPHSEQLPSGHKNGTHWVPAEVDVSIRPGWYYHEYEDHKVKSLPELLDIYYRSVGRNASFLLNIPIDQRGKVHPVDSAQLMALSEQLKKDFSHNLIEYASVESDREVFSKRYHARNVTDGNPDTYWTTEEFTRNASLTITPDSTITFNRFLVQEYIPLGQRVEGFSVEVRVKDGEWEKVVEETTIGRKRILRLDDEITADQIRFTVDSALASPVISSIEIYRAPVVMAPPEVVRDDQDVVTISKGKSTGEIYYTLNGDQPDENAMKYSTPFRLEKKAEIRAAVLDPVRNEWSPVTEIRFDIPKKGWKVISGDRRMIDGNPRTFSEVDKDKGVVVDLGSTQSIAGFQYLPDQSRWASGMIREYEFLVSADGENWQEVHRGEFSNIENNPVMQMVSLNSVQARYIWLRPVGIIGGSDKIRVAHLDVVTESR